MKDKEMAAASDLYLPFSLMTVIINHWNLKFCTDTDHKATNKFHIKCCYTSTTEQTENAQNFLA